MNPVELEDAIDRELKQLPAPRAPETLLPRVLAATVARPRARWFAQPWLGWPLGWQVASVAALVAIGVGLAMLVPALSQPSGPAPAATRLAAPAPAGRIGTAVEMMANGATLVRVLWQVVIAPVASSLLFLALVFSLACAVLWTALDRFVLGEASQR